jgi:EAL domain-containing protein (putative c-di-GMP-specific phosphodiesterase class I)
VKQLAVYEIKIDRSFVAEIEHNASDQSMIKTILGLAKLLGFSVVAEGVETKGQRDFLAAHECKTFQGFYFSRPLPRNEFEQFWFKQTKPASLGVNNAS